MKRVLLATLLACGLGASAIAADQTVIPLWNGTAPGSEHWSWSEETITSSTDQSVNYRNVVAPTLTVYPAKKPNGTAILVIPGGRFVQVVYGKEGEEPARWLNSIGITAFVLKYRLVHIQNGSVPEMPQLIPLIDRLLPYATADTTQAIAIIRSKASTWNIKTLGVMGFSAGGQLAVNAAYAEESVPHPDFIVGVYAAAFAPLPTTTHLPPAFLAVANDDHFGTDWSLNIYKAWRAANTPVEMHVYGQGNHGFAMRKTSIPADHWPEHLLIWMKSMGLVPKDVGD